MPLPTPFDLLRELLRADQAEGQPWEPETFAQRVDIACRASGAGRSWVWPIVEASYHAWHDAYTGRPAGVLEQFDLVSLAAGA